MGGGLGGGGVVCRKAHNATSSPSRLNLHSDRQRSTVICSVFIHCGGQGQTKQVYSISTHSYDTVTGSLNLTAGAAAQGLARSASEVPRAEARMALARESGLLTPVCRTSMLTSY